jgi:hypothetical protein
VTHHIVMPSLAGAAFGLIGAVLLCIFWEACGPVDEPETPMFVEART